MYPSDWRRFMAYFETETSRPYGKVIMDLHPQTHEKNRFVMDEEDTSTQILQRMEKRQEMNQPYTAATQNTQEEMNIVLQDPLMSESEKVAKYDQMMRDFLTYKNKAALESKQVVIIPQIAPVPPPVPPTPILVARRKRPSILTPPSTGRVDPAHVPLPVSDDDMPKKKWFSYSDDEEEDEEDPRITTAHQYRKRLRDYQEY